MADLDVSNRIAMVLVATDMIGGTAAVQSQLLPIKTTAAGCVCKNSWTYNSVTYGNVRERIPAICQLLIWACPPPPMQVHATVKLRTHTCMITRMVHRNVSMGFAVGHVVRGGQLAGW
jgi:hypothetical protein